MPHLPNVAALLLVAVEPAGRAASASADAEACAAAREDAYRANNLGVAYLEQYNYEQAAASFRRALEIDGGLTLARINLAIALLYVPDHAAAAKEATAALQQQPDAPQAHYVLGLVARSENRPEDGIAAFKRVLAADPRDVGALVNLGQLLMQNRQYAEAAALFRTAVEAEPYHVTATYNLAVALTRSGNTEEGQKLTQRFQTLRESGYGTTFSNNYLEQGRFAEALVSTGAEPDLVNTATPAVEFVEARVIDAPTVAPSPAAVNGTGSMTLADLDRDDDLDLIDVTMGTVRVSLNEKGRFTDATAKLGIAVSAAVASGAGSGSWQRRRGGARRRLRQRRAAGHLRHRIEPQRARAVSPGRGWPLRESQRGGEASRAHVAAARGRVRRHRSRWRSRSVPHRRIESGAAQQRRRDVRRRHRGSEVGHRGGHAGAGRRADGLRQSPRSRSARRRRGSRTGVVPQHARRHVSGCRERGRAAGRRHVHLGRGWRRQQRWVRRSVPRRVRARRARCC